MSSTETKIRYTLYHDIRPWIGKDEHIVLASVVMDKDHCIDVNLDLANRFFAFEFYKVLIDGKRYGEGYAFKIDVPHSLDKIRDDTDIKLPATTTLASVWKTEMGLNSTLHRFYIEKTEEQ